MNAPVEQGQASLPPLTLAGLMLAAAQAPLGSTMIAVALPTISRALARDLALCTSLLVTSYLIVNIIGQSPGGKLADVLGHARTVRIGMALQALGAAIGAAAPGLSLLVVSRCTMALGGALVVPATMALLRIQVAPERRGRVFGLVGAIMSLSAAIGPPLGGELLSRFGWRSIFAVALPCLAVAAALARLPEQKEGRTSFSEFARGFDWSGSALLALGLGVLVAGSKGEGQLRALSALVFAAATAAFVRLELRRKDPVLDPRLFRQMAFTAGSSIIALSNFSMYGLLFWLPQLMQQVRGASAKQVGGALFALMVSTFITSPIGGRLSDRLGARVTALLGLVPMLVAVLWLRQIERLVAPMDAVPALVLMGVGIGLSSAPAQASALSSVPGQRSGMAAGATSMLRYLGGVLSILMLGALIRPGAGADALAGYANTATAFAVAAVAAVVAACALPGRLKNDAS